MAYLGFPPAMRRLVNELTKLPSIGEKSAVRLAYFLLTKDEREVFQLADAIRAARGAIRFCEECFSLTETPRCSICGDPNRQSQTICVVEKPADVLAIERAGSFRGRYHVLHGLWSPLRGVSPEQTKIGELLRRIAESKTTPHPIEELILATSTTVEGDATALYIANSVQGVRISRIAQGLPKGGELEYADDVTLQHALQGRRAIG